jgi:hypothetical protein
MIVRIRSGNQFADQPLAIKVLVDCLGIRRLVSDRCSVRMTIAALGSDDFALAPGFTARSSHLKFGLCRSDQCG